MFSHLRSNPFVKWCENFGRLVTSLVAFQFLWALFVISIPGCLSSWLLWGAYCGFLLMGVILLLYKKILQKRWLVWFFVFLFFNFTIGAFVAGKIQECACSQDSKYCEVKDI